MKLKVTWKIAIFVIVLALSLTPAVLVNSLVGYAPVLIVLLCGIFCLVWILILKKTLIIQVATESLSCMRGEESPFRVLVENKGILPAAGIRIEFFISGEDGEDERTRTLVLSLSPREKREFGFDAGFVHIGAYKAGTKEIEVSDPLGLFKAVKEDENSYHLEILPQVVTAENLPISSNVQTESTKTRLQSPINGSEYTSVREYAFGDPIKTIHWKLSAHAGTLMTKQMESYSNTGVSVLLDLSVPDSDGEERLDEFDAVIEAGVAAGYYAARNGLDYDLMFFRKDKSVGRYVPASFLALNGIVREFRISSPEPETAATGLLERCARSAYSQANIVVCTTHADHALVVAMANAKQNGHIPVLFLILSSRLTERERDNRMSVIRQLQYYSIECRVLSSARELEGMG